jgi:ubiquinone/menaquinone biosynthesis C-methylase UbiE
MTQSSTTHNQLIQQEFTKQATAYATNPTIIDSDWALRLVQVVQPTPQCRVLEVATGPGYVALAFATVAREVVGVDLTDAPLDIARKNREVRGLTNVSFESADAKQLPFEDASFDIVTCRLAMHHFDTPERVFSEMVRVCRPGGKVAVEDMIASEQPNRAAYYNHWERLRDPSHVTALPVSRLVGCYQAEGLEIEAIQSEQRTQEVEQWMRNTQTPAEQAEEVRKLIQDDADQRLSGTPIFRNEDGQLCFKHRMVTVVGCKPFH